MTDWDKLKKNIIDNYFEELDLKGKLHLIQKLLKEIEKDLSNALVIDKEKSP